MSVLDVGEVDAAERVVQHVAELVEERQHVVVRQQRVAGRRLWRREVAAERGQRQLTRLPIRQQRWILRSMHHLLGIRFELWEKKNVSLLEDCWIIDNSA